MSEISFQPLWPIPLASPTLEGRGLGVHGEDSSLSIRCPIYQGANARSVYFCAETDLEWTWSGGGDYSASIPRWALDQFLREKREWRHAMASRGYEDPLAGRYSMDSPFGGREGGGHMLHAGGLMLILFTGLAVRVPEGFQLMVGPATNFRPSPGWTIQSGCYPSGFQGEFSLNFQTMLPGTYRVTKGMPFASGWLVPDRPPEIRIEPDDGGAGLFYLRKTARLNAVRPEPVRGAGMAGVVLDDR